MQEITKTILHTNMSQNMSEKSVQDCALEINFDYTKLMYFSVIVTIITALYYICYSRYCYISFPSCSVEFFIIYVRLTGRYLGELPVSTGEIFLCLI